METAPVATAPRPEQTATEDASTRLRSRSARVRRSGPRQSRCEVRKLDLWSVLKISLCFYLAGVVLVIIAGVVLWVIADAAGAIHNIEKFMGKILSSKNYHLVGGADPRGLDARGPGARARS